MTFFGGFKRTCCIECNKDPADHPVEIIPQMAYVCQSCINKLMHNVKDNLNGKLQKIFADQPWLRPVVEAFIRGLQEKRKP